MYIATVPSTEGRSREGVRLGGAGCGTSGRDTQSRPGAALGAKPGGRTTRTPCGPRPVEGKLPECREWRAERRGRVWRRMRQLGAIRAQPDNQAGNTRATGAPSRRAIAPRPEGKNGKG